MKKILKWTALLIVTIAVLLTGMYAYRTHQAVKRVMLYKAQVEQQLDKYGLKDQTQLVLAIIYTETKGGSADIMQSSESQGASSNTINNQDESIQQGVLNLADTLEYAKSKKVDVWTGVQAYNFGKGYINYVAANGGKNTLSLADSYSRNIVAPSLGNVTAATYNYRTLTSIFYNGGKLYKNGGNLFYAEDVQFNQNLINWFGW